MMKVSEEIHHFSYLNQKSDCVFTGRYDIMIQIL
nr:MAG TPA: hypothetical protein [Caudoviricetes sp.]